MTNQKVKNRKRVTALVLTITMLFTLMTGFVGVSADTAPAAVAATPIGATQNENQDDGIILKKSATANNDGTVDIMIDAYTTGKVTSQATATPADIVLVLDVSGSMDNKYADAYRYTEADGKRYISELDWDTMIYGYGFAAYSIESYYINDNGTYREVSRLGEDANRFAYYSYTDSNNATVYVYPELDSDVNTGGAARANSYNIVQFYKRANTGSVSRIEALKSSVDSFIDRTLAMNNMVTDESQKHRIAVVKYADNSYYSPSGRISDINGALNSTIGNNRFRSDDTYYNYTQLIHDFAVVDEAGDTSLKAAVDALKTGGATAVDYGLKMAQATLNKRTSAEKAARREVVIVFSDGSPTHNNGFESDVAGAAINIALALKNAGTVVYSLSVFDGANSTVLDGTSATNKFMHYISNNYPTASYNKNTQTINAGTGGSPTAGYYMTPETEQNLTSMFEHIIQEIGAPNITLGPETTVVDSLSPYFDLKTDTVGDVEIKVIKKTFAPTGVDAQGNPIYAETPTYTYDTTSTYSDMAQIAVSLKDNRQILVDHFDFDENYVSAEPRADGFAGRVLRIIIKTKPNYDAIDKVSPRTGIIDTNLASDPAKIVNPSQTKPIATTASPSVGLKKVSYVVDGETFAPIETGSAIGYYDVYRLPGSEYEVITFEPTKEGHTFGGWSSTDATIEYETTPPADTDNGHFTMPANDVVISGSFTPNKYNISYGYVGNVPSGVVPLDPTIYNASDITYNTEQTVASAPTTPAGYTFSGWSADNVAPDEITGKFNMPAGDVDFVGSFKANGNTSLKIEHYLQNLDGTYPATATYSYPDYGTTDTTATAVPNQYTGFTYNQRATAANNASDVTVGADSVSATIKGDGSTILKLYYNRNSYTVEYKYDEDAPAGAPALPATETKLFGEEVEVAAGAILTNYTFHGWISETVNKTNGQTFEMPAHNVVFNGHFVTSGDTPYIVQHWLQELDGTYSLDEANNQRTYKGHIGSAVHAIPTYFEGYKHNDTVTGTVLSGTIADDPQLVLKLYYDREKHNVDYEYIGDVPRAAIDAGIDEPNIWNEVDVMYKQLIQVAAIPDLAGYRFEGWSPQDGETEVVISGGSFEMPNHDVQLVGQFIPLEVSYTVKHIAQDENGGTAYTTELATKTLKEYTGASVTAVRQDFTGYTFNATKTGTQNTGTVLGDGSLILYLYYDRNPYSVEYAFAGNYPNTVTAPTEPDHIEGEEVTLKAPVGTYDGYDFSGWTSYGETLKNVAPGEKFNMPARNVHLTGYFTPKATGYRVEYYFENIEDEGYTIDNTKTKVVTEGVKVGDEIVATPETFDGFSLRTDDMGIWEKIADVNPDNNVLKLYYDRLSYTVSYAYWETKPDGAPDITYLPETYKYGATVTIKPDLYWNDQNRFQGWYSAQTGTEPDDTHFIMPATNVVLVGRFVSTISTTNYTVKHYIETSYGSNTYNEYSSETIEGAVVGEVVTATPQAISGYTYNPSHSDNLSQGMVLAGDALVLRLYYTKDYSGGGTPSGGGGITRYTLTYKSNGGTEYAKEKYNYGKVVDLDKVPQRSGYIFDGWHLDKELEEDATEVKMTKNITVYANWIEDNGAAGNGHQTPDSLNSDEHFAYVIGYPDGTVRPNDNITRAEVTSIFFRLLKENVRAASLTNANSFGDIDSEEWYNTAISTMAKLDIVKGRYADEFVPDANITRAEFAVICARFDDSEFTISDDFADVEGHWAESEIHEAAAHGWIRGYEDNTFKPDQFITRAEAMTMINRVLNRVPENKDALLDDMVKWPDNNEADWYYLPVQEATNSHEFKMINNIYEKWTKIAPVTDWKVYQ